MHLSACVQPVLRFIHPTTANHCSTREWEREMRCECIRQIFHSHWSGHLKLYGVFICWHCKHNHIYEFFFVMCSDCVSSLQWNALSVISFHNVPFFAFAVSQSQLPNKLKATTGRKSSKRKWKKRTALQCRLLFFVCVLSTWIYSSTYIYFSSES